MVISWAPPVSPVVCPPPVERFLGVPADSFPNAHFLVSRLTLASLLARRIFLSGGFRPFFPLWSPPAHYFVLFCSLGWLLVLSFDQLRANEGSSSSGLRQPCFDPHFLLFFFFSFFSLLPVCRVIVVILLEQVVKRTFFARHVRR